MILKIKNITIAVVAGIFLSACELNLVPESDLSDAIFWRTDQDFRQGVNNLYKLIEVSAENLEEFPLMADVMSDNAVNRGLHPIASGTYLPSANFGPWDKDYKIIRAANNIIEKLNAYESPLAPRFRAEAKFFRAYAYADLLRRYGDVPLIMKTLDTGDEGLYAPRTSRAVVMDTIYNDLDYAISNLPKASALGNAGYGFVSRGTALALKSRVALREGTWNKFHNNSNFNVHLQAARDASLELMQSGEYKLFNSYLNLFKLPGEGPGNKEVIWVFPYGIDQYVHVRRQTFGTGVSGSAGYAGISKSLVDAFLCMDGLPVDMSPLYQGRQYASSEFENRDPRLNGTVAKKGDSYIDRIYIPELIQLTGYPIYKYVNTMDVGGTYYLDVILMRYAEVLLNYAEAVFELNNAISDGDLDISINLLRNRVGMPHLTNAFITANNLDMQEEIRRERRVELGMEGFRYDDLLRWKTAEVELPKDLLGARIFAAEYPGVDPSSLNLTPDSIIIVEPASKRSFDPSKHYLWPLPLNQIALNPNLEQNPNW